CTEEQPSSPPGRRARKAGLIKFIRRYTCAHHPSVHAIGVRGSGRPVFRCRSLAGFECRPRWICGSTERSAPEGAHAVDRRDPRVVQPAAPMPCAAHPGPRALFVWVSLCVVAVVVAPPATRAGATTAPPVPPPAAPPAWMQALGEYAGDPVANRGALRVLEREDPVSLPPVALLALADARLRGRRTQSAERLFEAVRSQGAAGPWASYAGLGLGGLGLRAGALDAARTYYERVAESPGPSRASAQMVLATIASLDGDAAGSVAAFEALASDVTAPAGLQAAGRLGAAYA